MRYKINHTTKYSYSEPVPICQNKVHLRPRSTRHQQCREYRLIVIPEPVSIATRTDYFGNFVDYFSLVDSHRSLSLTAASIVDVKADIETRDPADSSAWEDVVESLTAQPPQTNIDDCQFAFDSEFAASKTEVGEYARVSFTPRRPIIESAIDLTRRIFEEFKYDPRATNVKSTVGEVFEKKAGVCQDFAHLQIACLRSIGLAARYVSGYLRTVPAEGKPRLVGADESHAWLSVYCGKRGWIDFDPTNNVIPATDHITVAIGRDYADISPIYGVFVGGGDNCMSVSVDVEPLDDLATF